METETKEEAGTLRIGEYHPAADMAMDWLRQNILCDIHEVAIWMESFASNALSGNRLAECCCETLRRLTSGEPVSDRYLLGLAWTLRSMKSSDYVAPRGGIPPKRKSTSRRAGS